MTNELLGSLLPAISIVFKTNVNRSWNGTLESRSFRQMQVSPVRNKESRYEIDRTSAQFVLLRLRMDDIVDES